MRKNLFILGLLVSAAAPLQAQVGAQAGGEELVDRVVAIVGDTVLLFSDVQAELAQYASAGQLPQDPAEVEVFARQVMESRVRDLILVSAARAAGISPSEDQVQEQVDQQMRTVQQRFGSEAAFTAALAQSGLTRDQYRQTLAASLRDEQMVQQFLSVRLRSRARPMIDERDIQAFFSEQRATLGQRPSTVSFRQVVVSPRPSPEARQEALNRAQEVITELRTGADFAVLARRFSDDPGSREHGGDLGWFGTGRMVPEFERVAFSLRPGQTSGIVETEFGFHIIRVDRTRGAERQARHILISPEITPADVEVAQQRADSVAQAIRGGASITTLAARYNTPDETSTVNRVVIDGLPDEYAAAFRDASANDVVGPIRLNDPRGARFAVARVTERAAAGDYTIDDVRDQIRDRLQQQQMVELLMADLTEQVYVAILM